MDGQPAQITIAQEFIYPTTYEPAPLPGVEVEVEITTKGLVHLLRQFKFKVQFLNLTQLHQMMNNLAFVRSEL